MSISHHTTKKTSHPNTVAERTPLSLPPHKCRRGRPLNSNETFSVSIMLSIKNTLLTKIENEIEGKTRSAKINKLIELGFERLEEVK